MPRQWEIKEVNAHGAGITDDTKNAPPMFQDEANNIIYDFQTHNLSNRNGSQILRDAVGTDFNQDLVAALAGFRIEQIFQLENHLIISAWSDATYSGKFITYDEKTKLVTLTKPPTKRKGLDAYSLVPAVAQFWVTVKNANGKGIEGYLQSTGLDSENTNHIDHLLFWIYQTPLGDIGRDVHNYYERTNSCLFEIRYDVLDEDGVVLWNSLKNELNAEGHDFDLITGTSTQQQAFLDGDLAVSNDYTKTQWGEENLNDDPNLYRASITSLGHLQSPTYIGEAFIATEPYDKTFEVNPADKDMADPENFPPLTERATIKRISNFWDGNVATSQVRDAQMPTTYISTLELTEVTDGSSGVSTDYKFLKTSMDFEPHPFSISNDVNNILNLWVDRLFGYDDVGGGAIPIIYDQILPGQSDLIQSQWAFVDYQEVQDNVLGMLAQLGGTIVPDQCALVAAYADPSNVPGSEIQNAVEQAMKDYIDRGDNLFPTIGFAVQAAGNFDEARIYQMANTVWPLTTSWASFIPPEIGKFLYNYAFHLRESYTKTDDDVPKLVENNGPAAFTQLATLSEISAASNPLGSTSISLSPTMIGSISSRFTRVDSEWFDFSTIEGVFSRTQNTGTVFYEVARTNWFVPNELAIEDALATFDPANWNGDSYGYFVELTDKNYDRDLTSFELAYFNGGVLSYTGLPQGSLFMDIINGTAYYGNIIDNQARVYQSSPGIPSSSPRLLFSDFDDPMTAVNSFLEKPIVFTENKTWRIEGVKDATGVGRVFLRVVSDEFGCIANQSVIKTNVGLFYWSKVGIIYTDGLSAVRVSEHLLSRFETWKKALMPNGLDIGPIGLRAAYNEVSKQIIYSGLDPKSVTTALDIYQAPTALSPTYVFPKGLPLPQVNLLTFDADLIVDNITVVTINGINGIPIPFGISHDQTMNVIAFNIGSDFTGQASGVVIGGAGSRMIKVTADQPTERYSLSALVTGGVSQATATAPLVTEKAWQIIGTTAFDLNLEIIVRDDGDAFFNEMAARLNSNSDEVIKLVDREYNNWTFTTNVHVEEDAVTVVTKTAENGYYVVVVSLIADVGAELWASEITKNGVLVQDRQTIIDSFVPYTPLDFAPWDANNNPGSFATIDPENFTWYDFIYFMFPATTISQLSGVAPYYLVAQTGRTLAQSFTATESGFIENFQVFWAKTGSPDFLFIFSLYNWDGLSIDPGSGDILGTGFTESAMGVSNGLNDYSFTTPLAVVSGQQYTIVYELTGVPVLMDNVNYLEAMGDDGAYSGGKLFHFEGNRKVSQTGSSQGPFTELDTQTSRAAQSFTAPVTGTFQNYELYFEKEGSPNHTFSVAFYEYNGTDINPSSGAFLGLDSNISASSMVSGQLNSLSFPSPIAVTAGQQYVLQFTVTSLGNVGPANHLITFGENTAVGIYFDNDGVTPWIRIPGQDWAFSVDIVPTVITWILEATKDWGFSVVIDKYQVLMLQNIGSEVVMIFRGEDDPQLLTYFGELETFMETAGSLLWITDQAGVEWKLTSIGGFGSTVVQSGEQVFLTIQTEGAVSYLSEVLKDEVLSSADNMLAEFTTWENTATGFNLWTQYNGMGIRKTLHLGAKHPAPDPYGVPIWINLDVYYGVSKSMPFYTADGPALLRESRRYQRDAFQTRVVWFSEDTLSVYRGQIGYDDYDEAKVLGSVILSHEPLLTADETYKSLTQDYLSPIDPYYKSVALSHGFKGARKWTSKVMINFVDLQKTGVSIQPLGWNDLNSTPHKLAKCINYQHFTADDFRPPSDPSFPPTIIQYFKNTDTSIYGDHLVSYKRRFPKGKIRNVYKQFGFEQLVQEYALFTTEDAATRTYYNWSWPFAPTAFIDWIAPAPSTPAGEISLFITVNENDYDGFIYDLDNLSTGYDIVGEHGDRFTFVTDDGGRVKYEEEIDFGNIQIHIVMTSGFGTTAIGTLYKDGVPIALADWPTEFFLGFGSYRITNKATFDTNNPLGIGNTTDISAYSSVTITKIASEPFTPVKVRADLSRETNAYVRGNGASYAKFAWSNEWFKIVEVLNDNQLGDPTYIEFIALTSRDTLNTAGIVITDESVIIGRAPLDQAIQLSDWTMTYTVIGDRTQGIPKATELGGHN